MEEMRILEYPPSLHHDQQQDNNGNTLINGGGGGMEGNNESSFVKVMTNEQLETLRTQIGVYATICEKLAEMYKGFSSKQDLIGVRLGDNLYYDHVGIGGHKITGRQMWTPTPQQLQILENNFGQGTGTPAKQKIKEITADLSEHGQDSEANVYNWFQNRHARSKRKQQNTANNNGESEVDANI